MKSQTALALFLLALAAPLRAGPRSSASYAIVAETLDGGGRRGTSSNYANDGSLGGIAGVSTVTTPAGSVKSGYLGQLYDVAGLALTAVSTDVGEGTSVQLFPWQVLDDSTFLAVPPASAVWSAANGPLTGISAGGLATAALVFKDTAASAQGAYLGKTGTLTLTVKNTHLDDFGSYAGDGLDDAWQNEYFGLNNPLAAPSADPDGDGQTNEFEFTAGVIPNDSASRFTLSIAPVSGQLGQKDIVFTPRFSDRNYSISFKDDLNAENWTPLPGGIVADDGAQRTITDPAGNGVMKFYRIEITK